MLHRTQKEAYVMSFLLAYFQQSKPYKRNWIEIEVRVVDLIKTGKSYYVRKKESK